MKVGELRKLLKDLDADDADIWIGGSHGDQHYHIESAYLMRRYCGDDANDVVLSHDPTPWDYSPLTNNKKGKD